MRKFQIEEPVLASILAKGESMGYFTFKDNEAKQGLTHLALGIEAYLQDREQYVLNRLVAELKSGR
jgi:hypothetical protein